jgi:hypothetical protein
MTRAFAMLIAGAFTLSPILAYADEPQFDYTPQEQQKMKKEADAKKAAAAKMTPEEKAAAKKARDAQAQKYQDATIRQTQNPGDSRNMGINKSAETSTGPTPNDAQRQKYQDATIKATQDPAASRSANINKSAADSKAGPTPERDYINTPEAEQKMLKQKGQ